MSTEEVKEVVKQGGTVLRFFLAMFSFLEKAVPAFLLALVQVTRIKQKKAEDKLAYMEEKEKAEQKKKEIDDEAMAKKSDAQFIREYLSKRK